MSTSGTGEESSEVGAGNDAGNSIDNKRGIVSEAVTGCSEEKYGTDSKNVKSTDSSGRIITPIPLLSSKIPNKNVFDRLRRKFI